MTNQSNGNGFFNFHSIFEVLEDRVLFDGVPDATFFVLPQDDAAPIPAQVQNVHQIETEGPREIIFVDAGVENSEQLLAGILESNPNSSLEVRMLDANRDGVEQISQILADAEGQYDAIHIISHGDEGQVSLGDTTLSLDNLSDYADELASWSDALTGDADLLFYGCELAGNAEGEQFIESISAMTGADVAASDDLTGAAELGGDWELEQTVGTIEALTLSAISYQFTLEAPSIDLDADNSTAEGVDFTTRFQTNSTGINIVDTDVAVSDADGDDLASVSVKVSGIEEAAREVVSFRSDSMTATTISIALDQDSLDNKVTVGSQIFNVDYESKSATFNITSDNGSNLTGVDVQNLLKEVTFETTGLATQNRSFEFTVVDSNSESSVAAKAVALADTDGDGVANDFDADADGDGVLNTDEGFGESSGQFSHQNFKEFRADGVFGFATANAFNAEIVVENSDDPDNDL